MKHIAFAVVAAAALAVIGPRVAQDPAQREQTAASQSLSVTHDYHATPRNHAEPVHELPNTQEKK